MANGDLESMPRGGPSAGRVSRRFDTDALEYLDRTDVPAAWPARVVRGLDRFHRLTGTYGWLTRRVLAEAQGREAPRILELGAGHGGLSRRLLAAEGNAHVTVSDIDEHLVAALASSDLSHHPRATVRRIDATSIDAPADSWDVAVFALSFHHLPPPLAASVIREVTRVARRLVIVDAWRGALPVLASPAYLALGGRPMLHDGLISARRMYSAAAVRHLAEECGAPVDVSVEFHVPGYLVAVATAAPARSS